jgi:hypothetical protein
MKIDNLPRRQFATTLAGLAGAGVARAQQPAKPDFNGVWMTNVVGRGRPQCQWTSAKLPFTSKGEQVFNNNKPGKGPRQAPPANGNDPIGGANPPGLYRALIYNRPFEMLQFPNRIIQIFEWTKVWRTIYTDGRPVPDDVAAGPFWYGYSVGKWEGDTLAVTTVALDERAWIDEWGSQISADAKVEEHWKRTAPGTLQLQITVHDPTFYSKPWSSDPLPYTLQKKDVELSEIIMSPMDEAIFNDRIRNPAGTPSK